MKQQPVRPPIILDARREGDRRQLARLLAMIAWRIVKEQAEKDRVSSEEQATKDMVLSEEQAA
jgi:hypothetical protein